VANSAHNALIEINALSRQLLSRVVEVQQTLLSSSTMAPEVDEYQSNAEVDLGKLISKRQDLITLLFEENSKIALSAELKLINEMVSIDSQLTTQSQLCKTTLTQQVIKLKKSSKINNSYKKY